MKSNRSAFLLSILAHGILLGALLLAAQTMHDRDALQGMVSINMVSQVAAPQKSQGGDKSSVSTKKNAAPPSSMTAQNPGRNVGDVLLTVYPDYPRASRLLGEEGEVLVRAELSETGQVLSAQVMTSSGFARLDEAAQQAIRAAAFTGLREGLKTKDFKVVFKLQ